MLVIAFRDRLLAQLRTSALEHTTIVMWKDGTFSNCARIPGTPLFFLIGIPNPILSLQVCRKNRTQLSKNGACRLGQKKSRIPTAVETQQNFDCRRISPEQLERCLAYR